MKKIFYLSLLSIVIGYLTFSCKKNSSNLNGSSTATSKFGNNPTASSSLNNSAGGVYKGTVVGSTGYFYLNIRNGGSNSVYALLNFDEVSDSLICPALNNWDPSGHTNISNAIFTSAKGTQDSIIFSVNADGSNPNINIIIPGHNTGAFVAKENSDTLVRVYQGMGYDTLVYGSFAYPCNSNSNVHVGDPNAVTRHYFNVVIKGNVLTCVVSSSYKFSADFKDSCYNDTPQIVSFNLTSADGYDGPILCGDPNCPTGQYNSPLHLVVTDEGITGTKNDPIDTNLVSPACGSDRYHMNIICTRVH